ncbi:MAG: hypothetical protein KTR25_07300 [Myxococcales bacterium]|nr:hypothetical protein [Myxococcales bacterium]
MPLSLANNRDQGHRARTWGAACILVGAISAGFAGLRLYNGELTNGFFDIIGAGALLTSAVHLQTSGRLHLLVHLGCTLCVILAIKSILSSDSSSLTTLVLYGLMPLLSTTAIGRERGLPWTVATILLLPLFTLTHAGTVDGHLSVFLTLIILFTALGALIWNYEIDGEELRQERNNALDALTSSQRTTEDLIHDRSQFINNVSHEFKTPLNHMLGATELLSQTELDDEQQDLLSITETSGKQLLNIIDDALSVRELERGDIKLEPEWTNIHVLLHRVQRQFSPLARAKSLHFNVEIDSSLPQRLWGDSRRIEQIHHCLLSNALAFTQRGTIVLRAYYLGEGRIKFEIKDSGVGIPKDQIENIFRPFYKVDSSDTRQHGGLGTGLSISWYLVQLMDGDIRVQSSPNSGSTFYFEIALQESTHGVPGELTNSSTLTSRSSKNRARVVLAEPNPQTRQGFLGMLERMGLQAQAVATQSELLVLAKSQDTDIIFVDGELPGRLSLQELLQQLRRLNRLSNGFLVSLMHTDIAEPPMGFDDHLPKPLRREQVVSIINSWENSASLNE